MGVAVPLGPVLETPLDQSLRVKKASMVYESNYVLHKQEIQGRQNDYYLWCVTHSPSHRHLGSLVEAHPAGPCGQGCTLIIRRKNNFVILIMNQRM